MARYVIKEPSESNVMMHFGLAVDAALTESNLEKKNTSEYLDLSIVHAVFHDAFNTGLPEYNGPLTSVLSYFWQGEEPEAMLDVGEELLFFYYDAPWVPEGEEGFVPLTSAARIVPEQVQEKLFLPLYGEHVQALVGIPDFIDFSGIVCDYKTSRRAKSWDMMDADLQPTCYAALLGRPIDFQYIELIRGDRKRQVKVRSVRRTETDIKAFLLYVEYVGKEIDTALTAIDKLLGPVDAWKDDAEALKVAASIFIPSPGRKCQWCDFARCHFRAGRPEL